MKTFTILSVAVCVTVLHQSSWAGDGPVLSLGGNGTLTWTNSFTNALFTVQWASSLAGNPTNTVWNGSWTALNDFWTPTGVTVVPVPMFYRVLARPATVQLGDAFFDDTSDQFPATTYNSVPLSGTNVYDGYGGWAGYTKTQVFQSGGLVAGVKTKMFHQSTDAPGDTTGDYWIAMDILGNERLLKAVPVGNPGYEASPTNPPPIMISAVTTLGHSWNAITYWFTVTDTNAAYQGYTNLLNIQSVRGFQVIYTYYQLGKGMVVQDFENSGFRLRTP